MESKSEQGVSSSIIVMGGHPLATSTPLESALRGCYSYLIEPIPQFPPFLILGQVACPVAIIKR